MLDKRLLPGPSLWTSNVAFTVTANCCAGKYAEDARKLVFGTLCAWLRSSQASCEAISFGTSVNNSTTFPYVIIQCVVWRWWNAECETWIFNGFVTEYQASSQGSPIYVRFVENVAFGQVFFLPFTCVSVVSIFPPMLCTHFIHLPFTQCNRSKYAAFNKIEAAKYVEWACGLDFCDDCRVQLMCFCGNACQLWSTMQGTYFNSRAKAPDSC